MVSSVLKMEDVFSDMALPECRERTFRKWPFKTGSCTGKEMAKAGFYAVNNTITCYYCFKELEGWEPTDVPFEEHKKHASYCCFIKSFSKPPEFLTVGQVYELEIGRFGRIKELAKAEIFQLIDESADKVVDDLSDTVRIIKPVKKPGRKKRIY